MRTRITPYKEGKLGFFGWALVSDVDAERRFDKRERHQAIL